MLKLPTLRVPVLMPMFTSDFSVTMGTPVTFT